MPRLACAVSYISDKVQLQAGLVVGSSKTAGCLASSWREGHMSPNGSVKVCNQLEYSWKYIHTACLDMYIQQTKKTYMSPNGSVKVSTNLFYAQAECWDLSRGSIWCNWKVCENQAKKNYICLEITAKCMWTIVDHAYVLIEKCGFLLPTSRDLNVIIGWIIWSIQMLTIKMVEIAKCCNV